MPDIENQGVETPGEAAPSSDQNEGGDIDFSMFESDIEDLNADLPEGEGTTDQESGEAAGQQPSQEADAQQQAQVAEQQRQAYLRQQWEAQQRHQQQQQGQQPQQYSQQEPPTPLGILDALLQAFGQNEEQLVQAVVEQQFKLSDKEKEALATDAETELPRLGAKIYVRSLAAMLNFIRQSVPQLIQHEIGQFSQTVSVEQAFFSHFPGLNRLQHGSDIEAVGRAMRAQYPHMSAQEILLRVGQTVMAMHGIQPQRQPQFQQNGNGNGQVRHRQQPFQPAVGARPVGRQSLQDDGFMGLGMEFDDG